MMVTRQAEQVLRARGFRTERRPGLLIARGKDDDGDVTIRLRRTRIDWTVFILTRWGGNLGSIREVAELEQMLARRRAS